jgi:hypothetical protein
MVELLCIKCVEKAGEYIGSFFARLLLGIVGVGKASS